MLYLLLFEEKEKKKKKEKGETGHFFPGQTCPSGCATLGFPWLLYVIKSSFKGQSLNFICTLCVGGY
jgi:hypothetical protein